MNLFPLYGIHLRDLHDVTAEQCVIILNSQYGTFTHGFGTRGYAQSVQI